jgi:competence protein CoiA
MQICALNSTGSFVYADQANKHQNYRCIECGHTLRLRHGFHRKAHYYHTQPNRICKLHAKGMPHLMLQQFLKTILPIGEVDLEYPFKKIGRIADVVWHPKRLVFEIQYSPISAEEVRNRNKDYSSLGYQVIWILHDERYNQTRLSSAENYLHNFPHYFSDMNADGKGKIYDQFAIIKNGLRIHRSPVLSIDPSIPKFFKTDKKNVKIPFFLQKRLKSWSLAFSGDIIDCFLNPELLPAELKEIDLNHSKTSIFDRFKLCIQNHVIKPYFAILKVVLEKACR